MNNKTKHLEMIQVIVARMGKNSFLVKGWTITIAVAMLSFAPKNQMGLFIPVVLFPSIGFALLDAYYLQLERKYRRLYDIVRAKKDEEIDFCLTIGKECDDSTTKYAKCLFSKSIWIFYLAILVVSVGIIIAL